MIQSPTSNQQLRLPSRPIQRPTGFVPWACEAMNRRGPGGRKEQILTPLPGRHQADDLLGKLWKVQGRPPFGWKNMKKNNPTWKLKLETGKLMGINLISIFRWLQLKYVCRD